MNRIKITQDLSFSPIVYGMWRLGDDSDTSTAHVQAKIEACLAQGITTMDQADIYGGYAGSAGGLDYMLTGQKSPTAAKAASAHRNRPV